MKHFWTATEDEQVRELYPHRSTAEVAAIMGRSVSSIYQRSDRLKLRKSAEYLASPAACRLRRGGNVGAASRFPKGNVPANKGLRRPGWGPGRMKATQFKSGERHGAAADNYKPLGTISTDPEGYQRIKVRDALPGEAYGFGNVKVWPLLQRHVWQQLKGPIPAGHLIAFRDGNKKNCALENLECITRRENMKRNTVHNLPKELALAIQLTGALKRKIRSIYGKEHDSGPTKSSLRRAGTARG
jgi:hypothetical protein